VTALSDIPIQGKMQIAAVGPWWCRHREEMIYTCTYSEMRILQLIVSGTLANAGRPERVTNKQTTPTQYTRRYSKFVLKKTENPFSSYPCRDLYSSLLQLLNCFSFNFLTRPGSEFRKLNEKQF
jgi:hypothetical protein